MIRTLTNREMYQLQMGRCPTCHSTRFQPGPRGGAAQNFECVGCWRRFNLTIIGRNVIFGEAIITDADWSDYYAAHEPRGLLNGELPQ